MSETIYKSSKHSQTATFTVCTDSDSFAVFLMKFKKMEIWKNVLQNNESEQNSENSEMC